MDLPDFTLQTGTQYKTNIDAGMAENRGASSRARVVATVNINIATGLNTGSIVDVVTLVTDDSVVLTAQSLPAENGVYLAPATGAASRAPGFTTFNGIAGAFITVMEGVTKGDTIWMCTSDPGGTLETTAITIIEKIDGTSPVITVENEGVPTVTPATALNIIGQTASVSDAGGGTADITIDHGAKFSQTADFVLANSTIETSIIGPGIGSVTIPANTLVAGDKLSLRVQGVISDTGNPAFTLRIKVNGVEVATSGGSNLGAVSNSHWDAEATIAIRTDGVSGTAVAIGKFVTDQGDHFGLINAQFVIDTTATITLDFTAQWGAVSPSNTVTTNDCLVSIIKRPN